MSDDARRVVEAVWRIESARIVAVVARMVRDVGVAEELAQDTLVGALERWPAKGLPDNPAAWLMTAARHRAIDWLRRGKLIDRKHEEIGRELEIDGEAYEPEADDAQPDDIDDDLLRLIFVACHPLLSTEARVALTLRLLGGLTTDEIARAFLLPESTIAQRIVRAKRTLSDGRVPFEIPHAEALVARVASVLEVIYLIFNEGYAATSGSEWMRPPLCDEALRLGRILAKLVPQDPEVHGLVALMEIQASRAAARVAPDGTPVLLLDQNRARWDRLLIGRGLAALALAESTSHTTGPYALQAAIAACHVRARVAEDTDWTRIATLYAELAEVAPSPVVELNRAVAESMAFGPAAGLARVAALEDEPLMRNYHLLPSVLGDLLAKLGRHDEARAAFERAASLTRNERERQLLLQRAADLA